MGYGNVTARPCVVETMKLLARSSTLLSAPLALCLVAACSAAGGGSAGGASAAYRGTGGSPFGTGGSFGAGGDMGAGGYLGSGGDPGTGGIGATGAGGLSIFGGADAGPYPYDKAVTFDWPESTSVGTCKAGHYAGQFSGLYASGLTFVGVPIPVAGNLSLTLAQSADGEFFTITGGKICGTADGLFPFKAEVTGTLDCATGKLVGGRLTNGAYYLGLPGIPGGTFEGPFPATYDKLTNAFTGTWKVYEPKEATPEPIYGGSGDWNASLGAATTTSQAGCVGDAGAP